MIIILPNGQTHVFEKAKEVLTPTADRPFYTLLDSRGWLVAYVPITCVVVP